MFSTEQTTIPIWEPSGVAWRRWMLTETTPVLFKKIQISNFSSSIKEDEKIIKKENQKIHRIWFQVNVSYEHFSGGRNGCELFQFSCILFDGHIYEMNVK